MTDKVISLVPKPAAEPDKRLIELLEYILEQAKRGEIRAAAVATVGDDARSGWEGVEGNPAVAVQLGGALMVLNHRYSVMLSDDD
jgi:hypothetical protein